MNKKYSINSKISLLDNLILTVEDSYITNTDQGGNVLAKDKYYIALKIRLENISTSNVSLDAKDLLIKGNENRNLYPSYDRSSNFLDIGNKYLGGFLTPRKMNPIDKPEYKCQTGYKISGNKCVRGKDIQEPEIIHNYSCADGYTLNNDDNGETKCIEDETHKIYVLAYEINKEDIKKSYELKLLNQMTDKIGDLNPSFKIIKFKPKNLLNKENIGEYRYGSDIDLSKTQLKDTKLKIDNIEFYNNYQYEYEYCKTKKSCENIKDVINSKSGRILVVFDDNIIYDESTSYYINSKRNFYEDFATINYKIGEKEMSSKLKDVTPLNLKNKKVYETSSLAFDGENRYIQLNFRNQAIKVLP
jgi:hypothetical protein